MKTQDRCWLRAWKALKLKKPDLMFFAKIAAFSIVLIRKLIWAKEKKKSYSFVSAQGV